MTLFDLPIPQNCRHGRLLHECALCDLDPPYQYHRETSVVAAHEIKPSGANLREKVYECISAAGTPICDEQIARRTGLNPSTARPRRIELERAGRIVASGTQITSSGRKAVAWGIMPSGDQGG